jgi:hypothetical protein
METYPPQLIAALTMVKGCSFLALTLSHMSFCKSPVQPNTSPTNCRYCTRQYYYSEPYLYFPPVIGSSHRGSPVSLWLLRSHSHRLCRLLNWLSWLLHRLCLLRFRVVQQWVLATKACDVTIHSTPIALNVSPVGVSVTFVLASRWRIS